MTWTRPDLATPFRRSFVLAALAALAAAAGSAALALALVEPPAAPVVTTLPIPPAAVTITVPAAAPPQVTVTAPSPPPPPEPAPAAEPPRPRVLAPTLLAGCYVPRYEGAPVPEACTWDDGFPAISADGSRIAMKVFVGDARDLDEATVLGTSIQLLDTSTGRVARTLVVTKATKYDPAREAAQRRTVERGVTAAQRVLDEGGYRALVPLGTNHAYHDRIETDPTRIHAQFSEAYARIVDPATSTVLAQHDFGVPPPKPASPDDDCSAWRLRELSLAWDPATKIVLATSSYDEGGCMCGTVPFVAIERLR